MRAVSGDFLGLVGELANRRIAMVFGKRAAKAQGRLVLSTEEHRLSLTCRSLHHRFRKRKYEATDSEADQMVALAELLVAAHRDNANQPGVQERASGVQWDRARFWLPAGAALPPDAYDQIVAQIGQGALDGGDVDQMVGGEVAGS